MYEKVIEGYNDYLQHPSKIGVLEYESQVDPYLHVGSFGKDEVSKTATGALVGKYTFYEYIVCNSNRFPLKIDR